METAINNAKMMYQAGALNGFTVLAQRGMVMKQTERSAMNAASKAVQNPRNPYIAVLGRNGEVLAAWVSGKQVQ